MAKKRSRQQEKAVRSIWEAQSSGYILLAMAIIASILILSTGVHPKHWKERDIVVSDVSTYIHGRGRYYQVTDITNTVYSIDGANQNAEKLVPGQSYHIHYANIHWNRIKSMTDSETVYVDYDASVADYCTRAAVGWSGILISLAVTLAMLLYAHIRIRKIKGK